MNQMKVPQELPDYSEEAKTRALTAILEEFTHHLGHPVPDDDEVKQALARMKAESNTKWQHHFATLAIEKWKQLNTNFFKETLK